MNAAQLSQLLQTAVAHHQAGRWDEAGRIYRQLRTAEPRLTDAWHLGGVAALQRGQVTEAVELLGHAIRLDPRSGVCLMRYALALATAGRHEEAIRHYRNALRLEPKLAEGWANLAHSLRATGQTQDAIAMYAKALEVRPDFPEALDLLGALIADTQGLGKAAPYFQRATKLNPKSASAWCNLGLAQSHQRDYSGALASLDRALQVEPDSVKPLVARGLVHQHTYQLAAAAKDFNDAIQRDPNNEEAHSGYLLTLHYLGQMEPGELFAAHKRFGSAMANRRKAMPLTSTWDARRPLKVAFLSADLRRHAVAYFLLPLLRHVDAGRFEVVLYHDHAVVDEMSAELRRHAALWRNFAGQPHDVVEKQIRSDSPDVLIDLSGHTGVNRLALFARRLAPVQITYLGYPNTTGLEEMDFRFTDAFCDPVGATEELHTEKLVRFAPTAWIFHPPAEAPALTESASPRPFTFGCFNNFAKITDASLRLWAELMAATPETRLVLKGHELDQPAFRHAIDQRLDRAGIDRARVTLLGRIGDMRSHLARYLDIDAALDPFPYHGTTTTCEALWMGVPVVTRLGPTHVSRVSGSLLQATGHPEWVAHDDEGYLQRAVALARAGNRTLEQREQLRRDLEASALRDEAGQAARFWNAVADCATSKRS